MSCDSNSIRPALALYTPVTTLKNVVLPEPFGPSRPRISPCRISSSRSSSAVNPRKRMTRLWQLSSALMLGKTFQREVAPQATWEKPVRTEEQHQNHRRRVQQKAVFLDRLQLFRQDQYKRRRRKDAPEIAYAAQHDDRDQDQRGREV